MPRPSQLSPDNILRFLQVRSAPASSEEIAAALHMPKTERRALYKMLSKLTKRRAIEELPGGRYRLAGRREERSGDGQPGHGAARQTGGSQAALVAERPATAREGGGIGSHNEIKGRLVLHHDGYGFVVPDPPVPWLDRDVFIPRDAVEDAMHGDQVLVKMQRVTGAGESQRTEGRIVRVLGRAHATVVGLFRYGARGNTVLPYDARMQHEIEIPPGMELTPGLAKKLGFSGADERSVRGRRIPRLEELDGAVVNVEVVRYPRGGMAATGRVIEILGRPGELGVDTEIIIRKHHLPHVFPAEVIKEAEQRALPVQEAELAGRQDFRRLPIVTIDGETARDFDDAVYVERRVDGGWHLQVHIADVAHYVRTLTALDGEARLRGTSVYFPDRAVPMLPEALSNGMCSLKPREDRLVMSALMEFDAAGRMNSARMTPGIIKSAERMTYTNVNKVLEGDAGATKLYAPLAHHFRDMKELALLLNARRNEHGSIDFDLPEPVIEFDEQQRMINAPADRGIHAGGESRGGGLFAQARDSRAASRARKTGRAQGAGVRGAGARVWVFAGRGGIAAAGDCGAPRTRAFSGESGSAGLVRQGPRTRDARGAAGRGGGFAHYAATLSEAAGENCGKAGGAHHFLLDAALAEAGAVCGGFAGTFCTGIR